MIFCIQRYIIRRWLFVAILIYTNAIKASNKNAPYLRILQLTSSVAIKYELTQQNYKILRETRRVRERRIFSIIRCHDGATPNLKAPASQTKRCLVSTKGLKKSGSGKLQFFRPYCDKDALAWKESSKVARCSYTRGTLWNQSAHASMEKPEHYRIYTSLALSFRLWSVREWLIWWYFKCDVFHSIKGPDCSKEQTSAFLRKSAARKRHICGPRGVWHGLITHTSNVQNIKSLLNGRSFSFCSC